MKSRSDYESTMKALHYAVESGSGQYNCQACQQQQWEAREEEQRKEKEKRQQAQAERDVLLQELLAMTYAEYLQSPTWKEVRAWAKREAKNRCQNCGNKEYKLWVHHINILSVRGEEKTTDLLVLCQDCHNQTYEEKVRRRNG